jgi:hypothetical protein
LRRAASALAAAGIKSDQAVGEDAWFSIFYEYRFKPGKRGDLYNEQVAAHGGN